MVKRKDYRTRKRATPKLCGGDPSVPVAFIFRFLFRRFCVRWVLNASRSGALVYSSIRYSANLAKVLVA